MISESGVRRAGELRGLIDLDGPIVKRQHAVLAGLDPPAIDQFPQLLRFFLGEIVGFGEVLIDVVQLPLVVGPFGSVPMPAHRLPAVDPDAAVSEHLEVLRLTRGVGLRVVERVAEALAGDWNLLFAAHAGRRFDAEGLQDGRQHVGHMMELSSDCAAVGDAFRPVDD